jgi:hypothetical protein
LQDGKSAQLTIGSHRVSGSVVSLAKPIALLRQDKEAAAARSDPSFLVAAVVTKKLVFNDRPQPIISATSKK